MPPYRDINARFDEKVERMPTGCWEWRGSRINTGYGVINAGPPRPRMVLAHRFAYERWVGPIPVGLFACHTCDNRGCVNPAHLFLGTAAENMQDMSAKGRSGIPTPRPVCRRGHVMSADNRLPRGGCRTCRNTWKRSYYARRHEACKWV